MLLSRVRFVFMFLSLLILTATVHGQTYQVLHTFNPGDGIPYSGLTLDGSFLYGTTYNGGGYHIGTLFKIGTGGSDYCTLRVFGSNDNDGKFPRARPIVIESTLYGTTVAGGLGLFGTSGTGTIFKADVNGNDYCIMYTFPASHTMGAFPYCNLIAGSSVLYGTTKQGGSNDDGVVFKIGTNGDNYSILHSFSYADGVFPVSAPTLVGSTIFGTTQFGGSNSYGTVFKMNADGSDFNVLHSFSLSGDGGSSPNSALLCIGSTLYGTTAGSGENGNGTVFKVDTDGNNFTVLHSFGGSDGLGSPNGGSLILIGSSLYGTTGAGMGISNDGAIFQLGIDGSDFSILHSFADGNTPQGDLAIRDLTFYGVASSASAMTNRDGIVYSLTIPEPSTIVLLNVGVFSLLAYAWKRKGERKGG